jgi:5,10-methylene-tetrahydrofolate dehydrogenase/methenyl tetrahydrofolate cyclohydrolase
MIVGDLDPQTIPKLLAYSPVPGGVGPVTVAKLLENVLKVARAKVK